MCITIDIKRISEGCLWQRKPLLKIIPLLCLLKKSVVLIEFSSVCIQKIIIYEFVLTNELREKNGFYIMILLKAFKD